MKVANIPSLDGIRAISVFIVLFSHAGLGSIVPGGLGVTIFFFLSGYLITTLMLEEYKGTNTLHFKNFFIRRFFRLFPPLLVTLLISYLLVALGLLSGNVTLSGAFFQIFYLANYHQIFNWTGEMPNGTGILWSLAVEEHFYLIYPFFFYFLIVSFCEKRLAIIVATVCILILCWRLILIKLYAVPDGRIYYATDTRIDSILFGCLMALQWNPLNSERMERINLRTFAYLLISLAGLLFSLFYRDDVFRQTFRYSIQGACLIPLFYFAILLHNNPIFRPLNFKWVKILGVYSYFIYLIHFIVINTLIENNIVKSTLGLIIISVIISVLYAFLFDKYLDSHFKKIRKKYR